MFTVAVKGAYPKFTALPRPSLLARAIRGWRTGELTDEELERAFQRAEVENVAEMVAAGVEMVWDGHLRWDCPEYLLGGMKGVEPWVNRLTGERQHLPSEPNGSGNGHEPADSPGGNGHHSDPAHHGSVRISDRIEWQRPILLATYRFLSERTPVDIRPVLTGPVTLAGLCDSGVYGGDVQRMIVDIAEALNREMEGLAAAGADRILIEEPLLIAGETGEEDIAKIYEALTKGIEAKLFLAASNEISTDHRLVEALPFQGWTLDPASIDPAGSGELLEVFSRREAIIELGAINSRRARVESAEEIGEGLVSWGRSYPPDRIWISSNSGLGGLSRETAFLKLQSLARGAELARRELARDE